MKAWPRRNGRSWAGRFVAFLLRRAIGPGGVHRTGPGAVFSQLPRTARARYHRETISPAVNPAAIPPAAQAGPRGRSKATRKRTTGTRLAASAKLESATGARRSWPWRTPRSAAERAAGTRRNGKTASAIDVRESVITVYAQIRCVRKRKRAEAAAVVIVRLTPT